MKTLQESLAWHILHSEIGASMSIEETDGIAEAVFDCLDSEENLTSRPRMSNTQIHQTITLLSQTLYDYTPDSCEEYCTQIIQRVIRDLGLGDDIHNDGFDDNDIDKGNISQEIEFANENNSSDEESTQSDDEEISIQEGECELCERDVKVTRHHLIPRSTWPRIKPRFVQASPYFMSGDMEMVENILSIGTIPSTISAHHLSSRSQIKLFLGSYTCDLCKLCHSTVHRRYDNMTLAESKNSLEKLLEDEHIVKFAKWANKQKSGKRANRRH
mmetsp:Transcript_18619/g.22811  ORF Transcript_18619/g.22811 Transcript_18619/m.22811 type:complete len:272 (-) Transcript_18619:33-848(-)